MYQIGTFQSLQGQLLLLPSKLLAMDFDIHLSYAHSFIPTNFSVFHRNTNQSMHLCSLFITLLLLFFLNVFTEASSNNPAKIITRLSIDCGSAATSAALNGREWIGDIRPEVSSALHIKGSSTASTVTRSSISADQVPHKTARISPSQFSYAFRVSPGEKILRLHFNPAPYKGFTRFNDLFDVEAGPFTLLGNFSASLTAAALGANTFAKEFCISVEENQTLSITFSPASSQSGYSTYAFINGIEIIPVPLHLSYFKGGDHRAQVVGQKSLVYIDNSTALELTHRLNMKRDFVSLSDEFDDMLGMWGAFPKPKENEINSLTWKTPVDVGFRYLIRIHFCDLQLQPAEAHGMSFKVLINDMIVDSSIFQERYDRGILPYRDYVVAVKGRKQEGKQDLLMSLQSYDELVDGHQLIKGFEIFKLSNPDNSLSSPNAFPPRRDSPSWTIQNLLPILCHRNATATLTISILALINIIVHMLREICEASITEEENRPSARAERLCRRFSLADMQSATKNFSYELVIGRGGFGKVYRGLIDNGRETVAIKRLKSNSKQGRHEFLTEIETLCELRHINLVSLIGYCSDHKEMIVVYEYMPSGTLADYLHKYVRKGNDSCSLTWKQRLHICIGAARGLDYLHTGHGVIHRDVKASNILLDENFVAKVSDFGLAKPEDRSNLQTHVSTKVKGTYGYVDPYYFSTRKLTRKSDTYAFGVVLLEVLCERQAMDPRFEEDEYCLTRWARNKINEGEVNLVASSLMEEILPESLKVFVEVAERCLHDEPKKRPTMAQVVVQLESALELQERTKIAEPNPIAFVANDVCPSNEDMTPSANTEQSAEASTDVQPDTSPPTEQTNLNYFAPGEKDRREPKPYKPLRFWAWDAFWNRLKPSKRKELSLISEICEADIRLPKFDLSMIAAATNQFSSLNKIGQGGYASVYKAVLPTGKTVAVKIFYPSEQGPVYMFRNEILSVSSLHHRNIMKLLGYCIHENRGMLLYEFMENGSLDKFISDELLRHQLQWSARFKVIIGIAKGVIYLHQESRPRTIHRDLNPSHILLDNEMNPKISGFGLSRNVEDDQSELFTIVAGTLGYVAPEIFAQGRISEKIDVFSFGVLVLEILSGKRINRYSGDLTGDAWKLWIEGNVLDLVDESLGGAFSEDEALRCIQVGLLCTQYEQQQRPTMPCVLKMLLGEELSLQEKMAQAQCPSNMEPDATLNWDE